MNTKPTATTATATATTPASPASPAAPASSQAVATKVPPAQKTLVTMLKEMESEIARALPAHITQERFARLVLTSIRKTPQLQHATPVSFFGALMTAAALGLEPGVNGEAYLVPYRDRKNNVVECQLIVGYQGLTKLFWQHALAKRITCDYVCENDTFVYDKGLQLRLEHTPADTNRGKVTHYYCIIELTTGALQFDVFTAAQIRVLRGGKVGSSGDIPDPEHWMERKTALKQVLKLMPKSVQLAQSLAVDERIGSMKAAQALRDGDAIPEAPMVIDGELVDPVTGEINSEVAA